MIEQYKEKDGKKWTSKRRKRNGTVRKIGGREGKLIRGKERGKKDREKEVAIEISWKNLKQLIHRKEE